MGILGLIVGIAALIAGACLAAYGAKDWWFWRSQGRSGGGPGPLIAGSYSPEVGRLYDRDIFPADVARQLGNGDGTGFGKVLLGAGIVLALVGLWLISLPR